MYGIFTYIYYKSMPNVGKYPIYGSYGHGTLKQIQVSSIAFSDKKSSQSDQE